MIWKGIRVNISDMPHLYIGRVASVYRTCCIYISDVQYLYIQHHRYIDVKVNGIGLA